MESWQFDKIVKLLEEGNKLSKESNCLLWEILHELNAQNPPQYFDLPGTTATITKVS